jgi:hypothetical protein
VITRIKIRLGRTGTPGRYTAKLGGRELCRSRQPFVDAARVLMAEGAPPDAILEARHEGGVTVAMRCAVGEAARWTVRDPDRGKLQRVPYVALNGPAPISGEPQDALEAAG